MLKGIDVSYHQGKLDWSKVRDNGVSFVIVRGGYGSSTDKQFANNMKSAKAAGLAVGVYWFSYALSVADANAEADYCAKLLSKYKLDLPVFYDFEYATEDYAAKHGVVYTKKLRTDIIKAFCERIDLHGCTPGVYVNIDYIQSRLIWSELSSYALWLAKWENNNYVNFEDVDASEVRTTYGKPLIWQFGKTRLAGIAKDIDCNYGYFNYSVKDDITPSAKFTAGDKVRVINTTKSGSRKYGKTYDNKRFVVYYDTYDVIQVRGDRIVIGIGDTVAAAVNERNLEKASS